MRATLRDVFADTSFWIALVVKQDQLHDRAQQWSLRISGRITTTIPILLETPNALSRPDWRPHGVGLLDHVQRQRNIEIVSLSEQLWQRGWKLYSSRRDKGWSLTDCISFEVMQDASLTDSLTADQHFRQAGLRAVVLEAPQ